MSLVTPQVFFNSIEVYHKYTRRMSFEFFPDNFQFYVEEKVQNQGTGGPHRERCIKVIHGIQFYEVFRSSAKYQINFPKSM